MRFSIAQIRRKWIWLLALTLLLSAGGLLSYTLFIHAEVRDSNGSVSYDAAGGCPIPVPKTARSIRYHEYRRWIEYAAFVRFEAPVQECVQHAESLLKSQPSGGASLAQMPDNPGALLYLQAFAPPWFDVWNTKRGLVAETLDGLSVWVDIDRSVCFCMRTD